MTKWQPGEIRVEPDGTRRYYGGMKYTPVPDSERKYKRHKPDHPDAFRWGDRWYLPLEFLPDEDRVMPETLTRSSSRSRRELRRRARLRLRDAGTTAG